MEPLWQTEGLHSKQTKHVASPDPEWPSNLTENIPYGFEGTVCVYVPCGQLAPAYGDMRDGEVCESTSTEKDVSKLHYDIWHLLSVHKRRRRRYVASSTHKLSLPFLW